MIPACKDFLMYIGPPPTFPLDLPGFEDSTLSETREDITSPKLKEKQKFM